VRRGVHGSEWGRVLAVPRGDVQDRHRLCSVLGVPVEFTQPRRQRSEICLSLQRGLRNLVRRQRRHCGVLRLPDGEVQGDRGLGERLQALRKRPALLDRRLRLRVSVLRVPAGLRPGRRRLPGVPERDVQRESRQLDAGLREPSRRVLRVRAVPDDHERRVRGRADGLRVPPRAWRGRSEQLRVHAVPARDVQGEHGQAGVRGVPRRHEHGRGRGVRGAGVRVPRGILHGLRLGRARDGARVCERDVLGLPQRHRVRAVLLRGDVAPRVGVYRRVRVSASVHGVRRGARLHMRGGLRACVMRDIRDAQRLSSPADSHALCWRAARATRSRRATRGACKRRLNTSDPLYTVK
jgi:hypothetical protein